MCGWQTAGCVGGWQLRWWGCVPLQRGDHQTLPPDLHPSDTYRLVGVTSTPNRAIFIAINRDSAAKLLSTSNCVKNEELRRP